jgi:hypothetical protein
MVFLFNLDDDMEVRFGCFLRENIFYNEYLYVCDTKELENELLYH